MFDIYGELFTRILGIKQLSSLLGACPSFQRSQLFAETDCRGLPAELNATDNSLSLYPKRSFVLEISHLQLLI